MRCNGKCYLARQLKQQENKDQQAPDLTKARFEFQPCVLPTQLNFGAVQLVDQVPFKDFKEAVTSSLLPLIFHPPSI